MQHTIIFIQCDILCCHSGVVEDAGLLGYRAFNRVNISGRFEGVYRLHLEWQGFKKNH